MVTILAIRHLQTHKNQIGVLQGLMDTSIAPIATEDHRRISLNKVVIEKFQPIDAVYCSTLCRTRQTANVYGFDKYITTPLLNELDFGRFENAPKQKMVDALEPSWTVQPRSLILGEPLVSLEARILLFLAEQPNYKTILLFGHGAWLRALLSISLQGNIDMMNRISISNNEILHLSSFCKTQEQM